MDKKEELLISRLKKISPKITRYSIHISTGKKYKKKATKSSLMNFGPQPRSRHCSTVDFLTSKTFSMSGEVNKGLSGRGDTSCGRASGLAGSLTLTGMLG